MDNGLPEWNQEMGYCTHRIKFLTKIKFLKTFFFWCKIIILINKLKPDIIHGQGIEMGTPALLSKIFSGKPYVLWSRQSINFLLNSISFPTNIPFKSLMRLTLAKADGIVALTEIMKKEISLIYNGNIVVIPNGIDQERIELRLDLTDSKTILCVSGFRPEKGVKYLLKSLKIVINSEPNARLQLVGYGPEENDLKKCIEIYNIKGHVILAGKQPHDMIPDYMRSSDILVLPSLTEGFPNVILEAMKFGLPIVATDVGGVPEIIIDEKNGLLVEPKNPEKMAEAILRLLNDAHLRQEISKNNLARIKSFCWEDVIVRVENMYNSILFK